MRIGNPCSLCPQSLVPETLQTVHVASWATTCVFPTPGYKGVLKLVGCSVVTGGGRGGPDPGLWGLESLGEEGPGSSGMLALGKFNFAELIQLDNSPGSPVKGFPTGPLWRL